MEKQLKDFLISKNLSKIFLIISLLIPNFFFLHLYSKDSDPIHEKNKKQSVTKYKNFEVEISNPLISNLIWGELDNVNRSSRNIKWQKFEDENHDQIQIYPSNGSTKKHDDNIYFINSLHRSIVFNNNNVGPDLSWIIPLGLKWSKKYKFDFTTRGHNTRIPEPPNRKFFGWNDGDAVGLFSYQFFHNENSSFGLNFGVRSIYKGNQAMGGSTGFGEGTSAGFRWDYALSNSSGFAVGAEQLIHFDNKTDTGRNIYITATKAWWDSSKYSGDIFPIYLATAGVGTGRLAVGNIKGLCSDFLGGDGTETNAQRRLCWAPNFSVASVWNEKLATFFEFNSRFFLLGTSIAPIENVPLRGTFALILSDHIDNYKFHDLNDINWVFNLSIGF